MNNIRNNIKRDFTTIPNALINDNELTDRARFLFCYMAAKPDDWKFYQNKISKNLNLSVETIRKYISELEASGWLSRELVRSEGKFDSYDYTLNGSPCRKNTDTVKNHDGKKPTRENLVLTNEIPLQKNTINNKEENKSIVETSSTAFLSENEIENIEQQIYASKTTKPKRKNVAAQKEKVDNPTPIREMFEIYSDQYTRMNGGEKPEFMTKYCQPMKKLYGILEARQTQSSIVPLDKLQPWRDFIEMWGKYLQDHPKETYFTANFNPATFYSQFNTIVAKLRNQPMTTAQKWEQFYRENTTG